MNVLLIPSTFTAEEKNQFVKVYKIGELARVATIFGINKIIVYFERDEFFDSRKLGNFIVKILKYVNTPPYLRKKFFLLNKDLKEAGIIPPLKAPHHVPEQFGIPFMYGVIVEKKNHADIVECGSLKFEAKKSKHSKNDLVIVDTSSNRIVEKGDVNCFFGFEAEFDGRELSKILKDLKMRNYFIVGTSKYGAPLSKIESQNIGSKNIAIVFGSAFRGLKDILKQDIGLLDVLINVVGNQTAATIRTEEAVYFTLVLLRYLKIF